jgi:hypothetical protein
MIKHSILAKYNVASLPKSYVSTIDGQKIYVRRMTGSEREKYQSLWVASEGKLPPAYRAHAIVLCACDEDGKNIFDAADVESVNAMDTTVLDEWFNEIDELNGFSKKAQEEVAKNLSRGDGGDS